MRTRTIFVLMLLFLAGCLRTSKVEATLRIDRTFHRPLVFRVESEGATVSLQTITYDGLGGYDKGKIQSDRRRILNTDEVTLVRSALSAVEASSPIDPIPSGGHDGSMWVYSGRGLFPTKVQVWTPGNKADLRDTKSLFDLGRLFWRLSKVDEPEKDLY